ncbi:MAG: TRAP transporter substrate-binding protein DctP [Reyranella sp.]|nr:TRAP transporter substrate-binding protein DctP [Reyranella sp.]
MHKAKKYLTALGVLGMLATGVPGMAGAAEKLVYATYVSDVYVSTKTDIWFMEEVERRSGGEITFERYFSGTLLKAPDLLPGTGRGAADIFGGAPGAYNKNDLPLLNVTQPFISDNAPAVTMALKELYATNDAVRAEFESRNTKVLYVRGFTGNTLWTREPVNSAADLKGRKIRAVASIADALEALGAVPVGIPWAEAVEGMDRGVVDGMSAVPFEASVAAGLHEIGKYGSDAGGTGVYGTWVLAMNMDRWNGLSPEHQKIIADVAAEALEKGLAMAEETNAASVKTMCATEGLTVSAFSDEAAAEARAAAAGTLHKKWVDWATGTGVGDAQAVMDQYVALVRKHEATTPYTPGMKLFVKECK